VTKSRLGARSTELERKSEEAPRVGKRCTPRAYNKAANKIPPEERGGERENHPNPQRERGAAATR